MIIRDLLLGWYDENKRDLPWRGVNDAYRIYLSEIILQQTRVNQGMQYYYDFVAKYPDIFSLASAPEEEILRLWQGLGYYSRARNMHACAKMVVELYNGVFPCDPKLLQSLPGIGDYTAAALASIAYNVPVPSVDGNVLRWITRMFAIEKSIDLVSTKNLVKNIAKDMILDKRSGDSNQAMIEFGAMFCKPVNPDCSSCIFMDQCQAFKLNIVDRIPFKVKKSKAKNRYLNYFVIYDESGSVIINKRNAGDIYQGLYDFPCLNTDNKVSFTEVESYIINNLGYENFDSLSSSKEFIHKLSHQTLHVVFWELSVQEYNSVDSKILDDIGQIVSYPVPKVVENYCSERFGLYKVIKGK
jgi:A/G-specific adenine glycosylase